MPSEATKEQNPSWLLPTYKKGCCSCSYQFLLKNPVCHLERLGTPTEDFQSLGILDATHAHVLVTAAWEPQVSLSISYEAKSPFSQTKCFQK